MIKKSYLTNSFIGKGEEPTIQFLQDYFNIPIQNPYDIHKQFEGIYPQVSIPSLMNTFCLQDLSEPHCHSSVDIVVLLQVGEDLLRMAVRVQGEGHGGPGKAGGFKGEGKSLFDAIQATNLEMSGYMVINIWKRECKILFRKDILNDKTRQEIIDSFHYKLPLDMEKLNTSN